MADHTVTIQLTRPAQADLLIGTILYEVLDEAQATGRVLRVEVPGSQALEREIKRHLNGNPDQLSIEGGTAPRDIGAHADGLRHILLVTSVDSKFGGFEFDDGGLPRAVIPPGRLG